LWETKVEDSRTLTIGGPTLDSQYNWISMIDRLAGGDILKYEAVSDLTYLECLNVMGYWKKRDQVIEYKNKQLYKK
jgi:hypothetical protein